VGGGISGLTTALQLAARGYNVTLYEKKEVLGGNLSSEPKEDVPGANPSSEPKKNVLGGTPSSEPKKNVLGGTPSSEPKKNVLGGNQSSEKSSEKKNRVYDVYPHMFSDWYDNFWTLFEKDLGLSREAHFEPRYGLKLLHKGAKSYLSLKNPKSIGAIWDNLRSGVVPLPDLFLWGYSMLDLASQRFDENRPLGRYSVNGFLNTRPYATDQMAQLHDFTLMEIWSAHGYEISAADYKNFVKHAFALGRSTPFAWMLKGSLQKKLIEPITQKLKSLGCKIKRGCAVKLIQLKGDQIEIRLAEGSQRAEDSSRSFSFDYVVLATPPDVLGQLAMSGKPGRRLVDRVPWLGEIRRLRAEPIPVLYLYLKRKLPDIPKEQIGLSFSGYDLTAMDLSQLWTDDPDMQEGTVFVVAASNFYALPSEEKEKEEALNGFAMIKRFHQYISGFDPGTYWGDPNSDVNWDKSHFRHNRENQLFINEVSSGQLEPRTAYEALPRVAFAGDFIQNEVSMATIEGAVISGLQAANAIREQAPRGVDIEITPHTVYGDATLLAAKLALTANAYWAKWFSVAYEAMPHLARGDFVEGAVKPATTMLSLPYAYVGELYRTARALWESLLLDRDEDPDEH
jgi:zeta-carotene desaturase